jgi:hypothetical protein
MFGLSFPLVISSLAGLCGGLAIGGLFSTETEMKRRAFHHGAMSTSIVDIYMLLRSVVAALMILILTFCISVGVVFLVFYISGIKFERQFSHYFAFAFLLGAGVSKFGRYLYWRAR